MKQRTLIISLLLTFLGMSSLTVHAQKEVTVRLNPKTDVTYHTNIKVTMMNMMEVQGQTMTMSQIMETKSSFTAKEVNDKEVTFEGQNDAIKLTISQMGMKLTYDSEHPENNSPMLAGQTDEFEKSIKKPYMAKYDLLGQELKTEDESEMNQLGSVVLPLPDEPLKVGTTWTSKKENKVSSTEISATMTYKVTKISKKSVEIEVNGTIDGDNETSGTYTGTATIDPNTGLVLNSSIKHNISLTISEQGLTIPTTINGTTTVTVE